MGVEKQMGFPGGELGFAQFPQKFRSAHDIIPFFLPQKGLSRSG